MKSRTRTGWLAGFALACGACGATGQAPPLSPGAAAVRIEHDDPPAGARRVGPIAGSDGPDCAILENRGTEERALADLRRAAVQHGIDYIKVTRVTEPYSDHVCVHKRYRIEGVGYAVASLTARAPVAIAACTPACAAGYNCRAGTCEPECDPPCAADQFCRFDRVCAARPNTTPAPLPPDQ